MSPIMSKLAWMIHLRMHTNGLASDAEFDIHFSDNRQGKSYGCRSITKNYKAYITLYKPNLHKCYIKR